MQIGRKMTEFEAFEVLSVVLEHPVYIKVFGRTDFENPIFSISSSQSCSIVIDLL